VTRSRSEIVAWVGSNVVPHEADLRARLRRLGVPEDEVSDVVQDAYLKITRLEDVSHIDSGRAYFFTAARNAWLERIRHDRVVRIDSMSSYEGLDVMDDVPGPERQAWARVELQRVRDHIEALPERCKTIFKLRRIEGLSYREIADRLGVAERTVSSDASRGLKRLMNAIAGDARDEPGKAGSSVPSAADTRSEETP
jgi:RNA polymerase sigma-70 factor (ECF subfamily)